MQVLKKQGAKIAKYVVICFIYSKKSALTRFKRFIWLKFKGFILLLHEEISYSNIRLNGR